MLSAHYRIYPMVLNCPPCCWLCCCCCCTRKRYVDRVPLLSTNIQHGDPTAEEDNGNETQEICMEFPQRLLPVKEQSSGVPVHVPVAEALEPVILPPVAQALEPAMFPRNSAADTAAATRTHRQETLHIAAGAHTEPIDKYVERKIGVIPGTWQVLPSKPQWEETATLEIDFSSQTLEVAPHDSGVDDEYDIKAFSLQVNPEEAGQEVIQHFILTELGLVEQ